MLSEAKKKANAAWRARSLKRVALDLLVGEAEELENYCKFIDCPKTALIRELLKNHIASDASWQAEKKERADRQAEEEEHDHEVR